MFLSRLLLAAALVIPSSAALAHEFWIEAENYQVQPGEEISAYLRNGEKFEGTSIAYFPNRTERYDFTYGGNTLPIRARMGDSPALQMRAPSRDGLMVVAHQASPTVLTYKDWETFVGFTEHKDFTTALEDHVEAGYPKDSVRERYSRFSKALIAIGDGAGEDQDLGLEIEIVALSNPYAADFDNQMQVAVTYQDAPRADEQIEVFEKSPETEPTVTQYRTDADGNATFPVKPGMTYLIDSVVLRPAPDVAETDRSPQWETLWASLTFMVPE